MTDDGGRDVSEQRTPGPWRLDGKYSVFGAADNEHVCSLASEANAAFIVRAANAHAALVAALEGMLGHFGSPHPQEYLSDDAYQDVVMKVSNARAALALAKEQNP